MHLAPSVLTWLRCFEAAARHDSFTRAGEELNLTQGAVSQQIRQLEQWANVTLFNRNPGRLQLTSQGLALKGEVEPALRGIERALTELRRPTAPIHVNCSPSFALRWLMPRLSGFMRRHPEIDIELTAEYQKLDRVVFARRGMDVAIRCNPLRYPDLEAEELMEEYLLPVASPQLSESHSRLDCAENLDDIVFLHDAAAWPDAPEHAEWQVWTDMVHKRPVNPRRVVHFNLAHLAIAAALAGQGVAMARTALVLDDLVERRLVPLSNKFVRSPARYALLALDRKDHRVQAFAEWLHEECDRFDADRRFFLEKLQQPDQPAACNLRAMAFDRHEATL